MDGHGKIINSCFLLRCGHELLPVSEGNERNVNYSKVQYFVSHINVICQTRTCFSRFTQAYSIFPLLLL